MDITLAEIVELINGELHGGSPSVIVTDVAEIQHANSSDITFVGNSKYFKYLETTNAAAVVLPNDYDGDFTPRIHVNNPSLALKKLIDLFRPEDEVRVSAVHKTAVISPSAHIGDNVTIGPHAVIESEAVIGNGTVIESGVHIGQTSIIGSDCHLHPNVVVYKNCQIGDRVSIHAGTVIGSDGFGYVFDEGVHKKIRQVGIVRIGNDVEIGSNCSIDRATLGETVIGAGSILDNQIQIGHNVKLGRGCVIVSQVGISGSTKVGDFVIIGGQAGVAGHITIGDQATIASQAGVTKDIDGGKTVSGYPAVDHMQARKQKIYIRRLPELFARLSDLEKINDQEDEQ